MYDTVIVYPWCMLQGYLVCDTLVLVHNTVMSGVWFSGVRCMIQWCVPYGTVMSGASMIWWGLCGVWYSDVWCMGYGVWYCKGLCEVWCTIHGALGWNSGVWCSTQIMHRGVSWVIEGMSGASHVFESWCIIHQTRDHDTDTVPDTSIVHQTTVWYTEERCTMHQTSLYHAPDITVTTRHHCIIHQTSRYHTPIAVSPDTTVSYARRPCIVCQTAWCYTYTRQPLSPDTTV